jgi:hypothetical protein
MNIRLLTLAVTLLASNVALSQQASAPPTERTEHAQGRGCVRPAQKEGCYVLHDLRQRRYWDLNFTGNSRPRPYTHIWFEGVGYSHDAHCSQGNPVRVSTWKILPGECSRPSKSGPQAPSSSNSQ